jgi:catechol 2,3-dioxygenase-like lactoylglutathione lyase family enzyme
MEFKHVGLAVADQERSRRFYGRYFGFDAGPSQRYPDGVLIIRDAAGFDLALQTAAEGEGAPPRSAFFHFGFRLAAADEVRELQAKVAADAIPLVETEDDPAYVGFKCLDPDGYQVEAYWEPPPP